MAEKGVEANFEKDGVEFRLGAEKHRIDDYLDTMSFAGLQKKAWHEFFGDEILVQDIPKAEKYFDFPLLLVIEAHKQ